MSKCIVWAYLPRDLVAFGVVLQSDGKVASQVELAKCGGLTGPLRERANGRRWHNFSVLEQRFNSEALATQILFWGALSLLSQSHLILFTLSLSLSLALRLSDLSLYFSLLTHSLSRLNKINRIENTDQVFCTNFLCIYVCVCQGPRLR